MQTGHQTLITEVQVSDFVSTWAQISYPGNQKDNMWFPDL